MNMYALFYIGILLEPMLGMRRMFSAYLLTGLCSAIASLLWHPETVSAGASGSIFGLYGIFLAFLCFHRIEKEERNALLTSILIFVGYNLLYGLREGIDNAAHVGGLISGFGLGFVYVKALHQKESSSQTIFTISGEAGIFILYLAGLLILTKGVPSDYQEIRAEWESQSVQTSLPEKPTVQPIGQPINSKDQLPSYRPFGASDVWLNFNSEKAGIELRYPSNWLSRDTTNPKISTTLLQQMWSNAANRLTLTVSYYDTDEAYEYDKKLSLSIPRNFNGEPSEDYKRSTVTINGLEFIRTDNMQHFGGPDEEGYEILQSVLYYLSPKNRMIYTFVMLINDEQTAGKDLKDMLESVRFMQPEL